MPTLIRSLALLGVTRPRPFRSQANEHDQATASGGAGRADPSPPRSFDGDTSTVLRARFADQKVSRVLDKARAHLHCRLSLQRFRCGACPSDADHHQEIRSHAAQRSRVRALHRCMPNQSDYETGLRRGGALCRVQRDRPRSSAQFACTRFLLRRVLSLRVHLPDDRIPIDHR